MQPIRCYLYLQIFRSSQVVVPHIFNPNTQEEKAGRSLGVRGSALSTM